MCDCERHQNPDAECTCICPQHGNFRAAHDLAMQRYGVIQELKARVEELQQWKAEALEVLGNWEAVWEALDHPGEIGKQKSVTALVVVEQMRTGRDNAAIRFEAQRHLTDLAEAKLAEVRALADEWESTPRGWVCHSCAADNFGDAQHYVDALRGVLDREDDSGGGCPGDNIVGWVDELRNVLDEDADDAITPNINSPVHVVPASDEIEHTLDDACLCGPRTEPVKRDDGSVGWLVVHHSLDGREQQEGGDDD